MRLFNSLLAFSQLHSLGFVSGRRGTGLDDDLYREIPRPTPTPEPLLYREELKHGPILMEIRLGGSSNQTSRRDLALGSRQLTCDPPLVLACPVTNPTPCCTSALPLCCNNTSPTICCPDGTFCIGAATCCLDGQVGCLNPDGCCPEGTKCCGIFCCPQSYECRSGTCVNPALSSLSVASVQSVEAERSRSFASASARVSSLESAASVRSKSFESELSVASVQRDKLSTSTFGDSPTTTTNGTGNGNGNNNNNVALVGGVVGAFLGAAVLGLIGVLLWRRTRIAPASQPIPPAASAAFPTNPNYIGGPPPVTHAAHPAWHPQQSSMSLPGASDLAVGQANIPSRQSASPPPAVKMWIEGPSSTIHNGTYGGPVSQPRSLQRPHTEDPVDPRGLYSDALGGPSSSVAPPVNGASSASRRLPHVPPYSFVSTKR